MTMLRNVNMPWHHGERSMSVWDFSDLVGESGKAIHNIGPEEKHIRLHFFNLLVIENWKFSQTEITRTMSAGLSSIHLKYLLITVPSRYACEIKMVHQEDAGLNVEMAKLAFSKGIWSYACKMDGALRKYSPISHPLRSSAMTAVAFIQKVRTISHHRLLVPPELDTITNTIRRTLPRSLVSGKKFSRTSKKWIGNGGLLLLGGVICLSLCRSRLCTKIAMPCLLKKLTKR
ncbi:hypothetical protein HHK36_026196 [Tetracentron sinense]|uniref:Uncharacterized protein n=1 Tax=Tetracentron sinense TaxID=13715 RepID=A0A834YLW2_TETSI|nr:hypothetical protein HHK36_026196 [Tetracentron sinense]